MPDLRLTTGSPSLVLRDGTITRVDQGLVWWADTAGRITGPARLAWTPALIRPTGNPAHRHGIDGPPVGASCVVLIPDGMLDRAVVVPLAGGGS